MSNFRGYLLKLGDTIFPNKYIAYESFKSTPNQRLEIEAYRDANALLHRVTSKNTKSKLEFNTIGGLNLSQKEEIFSIINNNITTVNKIERRCKIEYWNDEISNYAGNGNDEFYIPDIEYTIQSIKDDGENSDIIYKPIRIAFIQY